ncbi:hypothetical protein [Streptomyces sp. bgisy060]|uniref:hypothetical protein n=1 Tax=Streptomyces sp. bgisy060 TaxID=3413775 RepID=UPI003EB6F163
MGAGEPLDPLTPEGRVKIRSIYQKGFRNGPPTVAHLRRQCALGHELSLQGEKLLVPLTIGCTDDIAARRLRISLRTVLRMSSEPMNRRGARSRFEAGGRAVKEGRPQGRTSELPEE